MSKIVKVDTAISSASNFASKIEEAIASDSIAVRVEGDDYDEMAQIIVHEWLERFGLPDPDDINVLDSTVLQAAIKRARFLAVKPTADIDVSECGCIWALQTTYAVGSGDVILRNCDKHAGDLAWPTTDA